VLVTGIGGGDGVRADNLYDADGLAVSLSWAQHLPGPFVGAGNTLSAALAARMAQAWTRSKPWPMPRNTPPAPCSMPAASAWAS
jgi:hydroxymethylpyrimidine/phosphomethylpyrimidine kinase